MSANDGSLNAPTGTPQLPNLLSGYAARPPWQVAGVDYAVGIASGTALLDPTTIHMAGVSLDFVNHLVRITGNNVTLNGYNFTGWGIYIYSGAQNTTIENSYFPGGEGVLADATTSNVTIKYCVFDGSGATSAFSTFITLSGSGTKIVQYNLLENSAQHFLELNGGGTLNYSYNVIENGGTWPNQHLNVVQFEGGIYNNPIISYNTIIQNSQPSGGEMIQIDGYQQGATVINALVSNNTMLAYPDSHGQPSVSYMIDAQSGPTASTATTGTIQNNYLMDAGGGAYGFFYPLGVNASNITFVGNIDMSTGKTIQANNTETGAPLTDTIAPTISSVSSTPGNYGVGTTLVLTLNMSEAVTITGTPSLSLNDGGTATYASGSGSSTLTFSYRVGSGQSTSALAVTAVNGTIADLAGNRLSTVGLPELFSGVVIGATSAAPTISSVSAVAGTYGVGNALTLTLNMSEAVTVSGTPSLTLNDGGTATYASGSGTNTLRFNYTVATGQNTSALAVTGVTGSIADSAGDRLSTTGLPATFSGVIIDTGAPTVTSISAPTGDYGVGKTLTLTLNMSEAVTVTGRPTLTLNDGGIATYLSSSGNVLTFSYTVAAGQNTSDLKVTAVNLNGATIKDSLGNAADMTGATSNPTGTLQIDTTAPTITSVSAASGSYTTGATITLTLRLSEPVTLTGKPTLRLNDGGTATYVSGSGSNTLTFQYLIGSGQSTSALAVTALSGTIGDLAGNLLSSAGLPEIFTGVTINGSSKSSQTRTSGVVLSGSIHAALNSGAANSVKGPIVTDVIASPSSGTAFPGNAVTTPAKLSEASATFSGLGINPGSLGSLGNSTSESNQNGSSNISNGSITVPVIREASNRLDLSIVDLNGPGGPTRGELTSTFSNDSASSQARLNQAATLLANFMMSTFTPIGGGESGLHPRDLSTTLSSVSTFLNPPNPNRV